MPEPSARPGSAGGILVAAALLLAASAGPLAGQSVMDRSPNLSWGWTGTPGSIHLNTVHRFDVTGETRRVLTNVPTLLLGVTPLERSLVGVQYSSSSAVGTDSPNEWELLGRRSFGGAEGLAGLPLQGGLTVAYNGAAGSADGELALGTSLGRLRVSGALRAFSDAFDSGEAGGAAGVGARLRLTDNLALTGDAVFPVEIEEAETTAWSAGLQTRIPFTPHSLSLQATNAGPTTLQGSTLGTDVVRWGFEFTASLSAVRFGGRPADPPPAGTDPVPAATAVRDVDANTLVVVMEDLEFGMERVVVPPGTRVVWVNRDPVMHTATADDGSWDSGAIEPGETWSREFAEPGTYPFHCTPHPQMTGVVVVEP